MQTLFIFIFVQLLICTVQDSLSRVNFNKTNLESLEIANNTQITIASEGGSIVSNSPTVLLKDHTNSINLFSDLSKSNGKSVAARKGVSYYSTDSPLTNNTVIINKTSSTDSTPVPNPKNEVLINIIEQKNSTNYNNSDLVTSTVHKPLVLSYEALAEMDAKNHVKIMENEPSTKVHILSSYYSHPGMVMPIVITILVVPMFAAVGYMALKRGREAWKNRHYKRMDFLLDGMYNE